MLLFICYTFLIVIAIAIASEIYNNKKIKNLAGIQPKYSFDKIRHFSYRHFIKCRKELWGINLKKPILLKINFSITTKGHLKIAIIFKNIKSESSDTFIEFYVKDFYHNIYSSNWIEKNSSLSLKILLDFLKSCSYEKLQRIADCDIDLYDEEDMDIYPLYIFVRNLLLMMWSNKDAMEKYIYRQYYTSYECFMDTRKSLPYITHLRLNIGYYNAVSDPDEILLFKNYIDKL